ncbi:MAG TPA: glycosyltransferase family 2 protein [Bacteroidales bacterium]|nr:glycosyltransferase family 2 protein [Bacteroidales bacterium]
MHPKLNILIVNYNGKHLLENLFASMEQQDFGKSRYALQIWVVDNGSSDGSQAYLRSLNHIRCIEAGSNLGFAKANNLALSQMKGTYCLMLNSDTLFTDKSNLDDWLDWMDKQTEVGISSPKLIRRDGTLDPACHRGEPDPWTAFCYFSGLARLFPNWKTVAGYHQTYKNLDATHLIDACSGAALLLRLDAIEDVGLLDERFFMYAEDLDWCKRFRDSGYSVAYYPSVEIIHLKYQSGLENQAAQRNTNHWFYTTMLQYYDKHYANQYPGIVRWVLHTWVHRKLRQPSKMR